MSRVAESTDTGTPALDITRIRPDEFTVVDALVTGAYEFDYGPRDRAHDDVHRAEVRSGLFDVWVARDRADGRLVGSVTTAAEGGQPLMEDALPGELDFRLLAVAPDARRRGIGAALTLDVIRIARERGRTGVFMKSAPTMVKAHRLYERLGFRRDPARDGLLLEGVRHFDHYAFVLDLEPASATPPDRTETQP